MWTAWPPGPQAHHSIAISRPAPSRHAARRFPAAASAAKPASPNNPYSQNILPKPGRLGGKTLPRGGASVPAVVETATVTDVDDLPFSVTGLGVSVQVESEGAPVHVKLTVWLSPPIGLIAKA